MNLSGNAVRYWMQKENIPLENLLVITDDLALPFGTLRMKMKGSHGGHNGLRNIEAVLNTGQYTRLRFGISADFKEGQQVDYVLGSWSEEEKKSCRKELISFLKQLYLLYLQVYRIRCPVLTENKFLENFSQIHKKPREFP